MTLLGSLARRQKTITLASAGIDLALIAAKVVVGLLAGSLALISDAVHSGLDLTSSLLAYVAVRAAGRPADAEHPYGHGRAENLAAYTEGMLLLVAAAFIAFEAIQRLRSPTSVEVGAYVLALLLFILVLEICRSLFLSRVAAATGSPAISALATDKGSDLISVSAVLVGLVLTRLGVANADPIAALVVAGLIVWAAVRLLKQSTDFLMDRSIRDAATAVADAAGHVPGIKEVRSVRVRGSGPELIGELEVAGRRTLALEAADDLAGQVQRAVAERLPNMQLTVLVKANVDESQLVERVHAAAARNGSFRDLHDVVVEQEVDGHLHLSLHAKLPSQLSMREARGLVEVFERDLRTELPDVTRIDVHLEPLEPDLVYGREVTAAHPELVDRIRAVLRDCQLAEGGGDVELSSRRGEITAHAVVRVGDDLTLEQAHEVETELETTIQRAVPEVRHVVVRATA
jgi:cation diffusion facilitator family transporter